MVVVLLHNALSGALDSESVYLWRQLVARERQKELACSAPAPLWIAVVVFACSTVLAFSEPPEKQKFKSFSLPFSFLNSRDECVRTFISLNDLFFLNNSLHCVQVGGGGSMSVCALFWG